MHFRNFLRNLVKSFENFVKLAFLSKHQRFKACFPKSFEKYAKIMHFRNFLKKSFEILRKFSQIIFFVQTPKNLTHGFPNCLKNMLK